MRKRTIFPGVPIAHRWFFRETAIARKVFAKVVRSIYAKWSVDTLSRDRRLLPCKPHNHPAAITRRRKV